MEYLKPNRHLKRLSLYAVKELKNIHYNKIDIAKMCRQARENLKVKIALNQTF